MRTGDLRNGRKITSSPRYSGGRGGVRGREANAEIVFRPFLIVLTWLNAFTLMAALPAAAAQRSDKPNVLFILVDDYGIQDVGIEGSTFYETPHIDALARGGMRFTRNRSRPARDI